MKTESNELCIRCRNLPYSRTGLTVGQVIDLYNAGDVRLTQLDEYRFYLGVYGVLHKALDDCSGSELCCSLIRTRYHLG